MIHNNPFNESQPTALLQSVDTKARGLWSAKKSIKGGSLQTLPPVKTNYIPQTFPIKATVNFYPFLMENPKDRHWSRASHAAKNGAKRKINAANNWTAFRNFYLLIITFLIYIFSWFLLQKFFFNLRARENKWSDIV